MIETFRTCKRAYELAFTRFSSGPNRSTLSSLCKRFVLKAVAEVNRGRLSNVQQVQKYMGQGWPLQRTSEDLAEKDLCTRAFLFAFKTLNRYVSKPYRPAGSEIAAVALKVRARVAHVRVYVEDTIDLILWYPSEKRLELVNFQMQPLKPVDPAWPNASLVVKAYLAERLKIRWPFEKLSIMTCRLGTQDYVPISVVVDENLYKAHWAEVAKALEEMKEPLAKESACSAGGDAKCALCQSMRKLAVYESVLGYGPNALSA